jgi:hypothetical protein
MKMHSIAGILALTAVLTACADATLGSPETRTPPVGAAFDGIGFGSGGFTQDSASSQPMAAPTTSCKTSEEESAGGVGFGSGGRTETCPTDPR